MNIKPGKQTTEFWATLAPWILAFGVLVLIGIGAVNPTQGAAMFSALGIGGGYAAGRYAESRGRVKEAASFQVGGKLDGRRSRPE